MGGSDWSVIGALLGVAFIVVGTGIRYAYRRILPYKKDPEGRTNELPEALVGIFSNFMRGSNACLIAGVILLIGAHLIGPGLTISDSGLGIVIPVSLYYAGALGLLLVILTYNVLHHHVRARFEAEGGKDELSARIGRVHANFTEYAPLGLGLLILLDWTGPPAAIVHFAGTLFVAARYLHAYGYTKHPLASFGRVLGIQGTLLALAFMSAATFLFAFS